MIIGGLHRVEDRDPEGRRWSRLGGLVISAISVISDYIVMIVIISIIISVVYY